MDLPSAPIYQDTVEGSMDDSNAEEEEIVSGYLDYASSSGQPTLVLDQSTLHADVPMDVDLSGLMTSKSPASVVESSEQNEYLRCMVPNYSPTDTNARTLRSSILRKRRRTQR